MCTLERLLEETAASRGAFNKREKNGKGDYLRVWDAMNRYLSAVLNKRQTLNLPNFCKIGWKVEAESLGNARLRPSCRARLRPHFQLNDSFARAHGLVGRSHPPVPDQSLTAVEEFNFSKAAIRFSQSLTKDQLFVGLRHLLHCLGDIAASGASLSIEFELGKLLVTDRDVHFVFVSDLYLQEGLDVPQGAIEATGYKPSVTYGAPSKDALSLHLQGSNAFSDLGETDVQLQMAPTQDAASSSPSMDDFAVEVNSQREHYQTLEPTASLPSAMSNEELCQQEALGRHIAGMEIEADAELAMRGQWETHLKRCDVVEEQDDQWRRALALDHAESLKDQIRQAEERRAAGRQHQLEQASMHDFPDFTDARIDMAQDMLRSFVRDRRDNLREDLDQQIDIKQRIRMADAERERELEAIQAEAIRNEIVQLRAVASAKKVAARSAVLQAWDTDVRLHTVQKAIKKVHKSPLQVATPTLGALTPRDASFGPPSSRPITGSVRRAPLGAAASLALQKTRLGGALR